MKKYIILFMIVAVAFLFVGQTDSLAKTARQATAELAKDHDGVTYYQLKTPKIFQYESKANEDKESYRLGKWFVTEVESLQKRVIRFWDRVLPIIYKNYRTIAVAE